MPSWRQLHIRIPEPDHEFLAQLARSREEAVATIVRRLIRALRASSGRRDLHTAEPVFNVPPPDAADLRAPTPAAPSPARSPGRPPEPGETIQRPRRNRPPIRAQDQY